MTRLRRALPVLLVPLAASGAEPPASAPIEQVRRDLRELPRLQGDLSAPGRTLPELALPAMAAPAPAPVAPPTTKEELKRLRDREKAQRDWLLDAMDQEEDAEKDEVLSLEDWIAEVQDLSPPEPESEAREFAPPPAVDNPLAGFMAEWMTPDDYQLLHAGPADPLGATGAPDMTRNAPVSVPAPEPARVNPFLDAFALDDVAAPPVPSAPAVPTPRFDAAPPPLFPATPTPSGAVSPPGVDAPARERTPWQPPASPDDRYFPQLKRF